MDAIMSSGSSSSTDNYWDYNESSSISWTDASQSWNSIYYANNSSGGDGRDKDLIPSVAAAAWDVSTFLHQELGPKQLPIDVVVPITVVYILIFVSGVVGNVAICAVIIRNPSMHTATNCYLFSLAVADLIALLFGLPNDLSVYWEQYPWALGETVCKMRALIAEMTNYASVLTIVAFSLERYLAICHPLHAYRMAGVGRAAKILAVIWFVALVSAVPFAVFTCISFVLYPIEAGPQLVGQPILESAFCAMLDVNRPENWPLLELATFIFFILPMGMLCLLYLRIGIRIRRTSLGRGSNVQSGAVHRSSSRRSASSRKNILRMLVAVVIAFFICWAPFHAQRLLYVYAKQSPYYREINEKMFFITGCFYYLASTINPILYNVMSARYREAFLQTLCTLPGGAGNQFANRFHYHASSSSMRNHLNSSRGGSSRPGGTGSGSTATSTLGNNRISERRTISSLLPHHQNNNSVQSVAVRIVEDPAAEEQQQQQQQQNEMDHGEMRLLGSTSIDRRIVRNGGGSPRCLSAAGDITKQEQQQEPSIVHHGETAAEWQDIDPSIVTSVAPAPAVTEWRNAPVHLLLTKTGMNNSSSGGAGTVLPAGCTPHCFKSSQLVRRASETINSNNLIKDRQQQQQHPLSEDAIINCQQQQQDDDENEEEINKENDALLGIASCSTNNGDDIDAIAPSTTILQDPGDVVVVNHSSNSSRRLS